MNLKVNMILTFIHGYGVDRGIEWLVDAPIDTYVEASIDIGTARETSIGIERGFDGETGSDLVRALAVAAALG